MALAPGELGERIATARREAGLTQGACAARAAIERTALAKIETGARRVGAVELARLADALDVRIEWFFEDAPQSVVSRRNAAEAGAPSPAIDRSVERLAREIEFLQRIGPDLDLPASPELAVPETMQEAEAAAGEARRMLGYDEGQPAIGLAERAADLGLLVFSLALGDDAADGASILLSRGGVALVNGSRALGRRRLTLAHELGHFMFADEFSTDWSVADDPASKREARIDRFARALLLPGSALRTAWQSDLDTRTRAVLVASEYRVDMSTLSRRLRELGVASPEEATVVRSTRTRKADIVEHALLVPQDLAPPEFPRAYVRAVLNAYRSEEISAARAIGMLPETWAEDDLPDLRRSPSRTQKTEESLSYPAGRRLDRRASARESPRAGIAL